MQKILTVATPGRWIFRVHVLWITQMVPSCSIIIATDGECPMCSGFSLAGPIHPKNFEFIANYFGSLSLSPRRGYEGAIFVGSTHNGASTPQWTTIEDSTEEFLTMSSGEGRFGHPSPRWHFMGGSLPPLQQHGKRVLQP
jgi:hypothetical protein